MTAETATRDRERAEAAAGWVLRLRQAELSEATALEWIEWCEADPRNRAAFEAMAELWETSGEIGADRFAAELRRPANDDRGQCPGPARTVFLPESAS